MMGIFFKLELFCHLNRKVSMKMNCSKKNIIVNIKGLYI